MKKTKSQNKRRHSRKTNREERVLKSVAESVGSTLGAIAAKAEAARNVFTHRKPRRRTKTA